MAVGESPELLSLIGDMGVQIAPLESNINIIVSWLIIIVFVI